MSSCSTSKYSTLYLLHHFGSRTYVRMYCHACPAVQLVIPAIDIQPSAAFSHSPSTSLAPKACLLLLPQLVLRPLHLLLSRLVHSSVCTTFPRLSQTCLQLNPSALHQDVLHRELPTRKGGNPVGFCSLTTEGSTLPFKVCSVLLAVGSILPFKVSSARLPIRLRSYNLAALQTNSTSLFASACTAGCL